MRNIVRISIGAGVLAAVSLTAFAQAKGVFLSDLTWLQAEKALKSDTVVVIPLGAESKEHGPHLKLNTDFVQAEYLKEQVVERANVVVAPTINYNYFPAFVDYPGDTSLSLETSRDMVVEICRALAKFGPRRFYVLNMGVSTIYPLRAAAEVLAAEGILLAYTASQPDRPGQRSIDNKVDPVAGTHANESETSVMLYMDPASVDMSRAVKDYHPSNTPGRSVLTRNPNKPGVYSASGVYGDATLATRQRGERETKATLEGILKDIEDLRKLGTHD
jgi:creatinine amidohydrolase